MLEFKNLKGLEGLIRVAYYMSLPAGVRTNRMHATIQELSNWANEVEIHMYYCGGSVYFNNKEDQAMFILRWM